MLIALSCLVYFASYITRLSYGAALSEILVYREIGKSAAGLVSTGGFLAYGIGQIFSGILGDRYKPRNLIFIGLGLSSFMNILLPLATSSEAMLFLWTINGLAQAMIWPPLLKTMTLRLSQGMLKKAFVWVSAASSLGTVSVYLLVPLCITWSNWKVVFHVAGGFGALVAMVWYLAVDRMEVGEHGAGFYSGKEAKEDRKVNYTVLKWIVVAILIQGTLRDGIITWLPTYLGEVFHLPNATSILITVLLPIFTIVSVQGTAWMYGKVFHNEVSGASLLFAVAAIASVSLMLSYDVTPFLAISLAAITTGCINGINLILISIVPARFVIYGKVSTVSGVLNAFTYAGSALSTYAIGKFAEGSGWQFTIGTWALLAFSGLVVSLIGMKSWKTFVHHETV